MIDLLLILLSLPLCRIPIVLFGFSGVVLFFDFALLFDFALFFFFFAMVMPLLACTRFRRHRVRCF